MKTFNILRLSIAILTTALFLLIVGVGCSVGMLDVIQQKIKEDRIADGTIPTYVVIYHGNGADGGDEVVAFAAVVEGAAAELGEEALIVGAGELVVHVGGEIHAGVVAKHDVAAVHHAPVDVRAVGEGHDTLPGAHEVDVGVRDEGEEVLHEARVLDEGVEQAASPE